MKNFKGLILECRDLLLEAKESSMIPIFEEMYLDYFGKDSYEELSDNQKRETIKSVEEDKMILKKKLEGFNQHECSWMIQEFINNCIYTKGPKTGNHFVWPEDFGKVSDLVIAYNKLKKFSEPRKKLKTDLMKYDYNSLRDIIQELEEFNIDEGNNEILYDKDDWKVYKLVDYSEAMKLIKNNQNSWCIKEEVNFNNTYNKPFYAIFQNNKPFACGNIQRDKELMYLKNAQDDKFKHVNKEFMVVVDWLLLVYLKDEILKKPFESLGDLEFVLQHDSKRYNSLFGEYVIRHYAKNNEKVSLYYSLLSQDEHDDIRESKIHQAIVKGEDVSIEDINWIFYNQGIFTKDEHFNMDCFSLASRVGNINVLKKLFNIGAGNNRKDDEDFIRAIKRGYIEAVELFLKHGYTVDSKFKYSESDEHNPLFVACKYGQKKVVQFLIDKGCSINTIYLGQNALRIVCGGDHSDIIKILINNKIKLEDKELQNIMLNTIRQDRRDSVIELLKCGYNVNGKTWEDNILFTVLSTHHTNINIILKTKMIATILKYGKNININTIDDEGCNCLMVACQLGSKVKDIVKSLINFGSDVNLKSTDGETPLLISCKDDNYDTMELLLKSGADANVKNSNGNYPLHICLNSSHYTIELLLKHGADVSLKNHMGLTPLELAKDTNRNSQIIRLLQDYEKKD